eukprot:COSAG02_NODE_406_length_22916_cov_35.137529_14_plen_59_part_00
MPGFIEFVGRSSTTFVFNGVEKHYTDEPLSSVSRIQERAQVVIHDIQLNAIWYEIKLH